MIKLYHASTCSNKTLRNKRLSKESVYTGIFLLIFEIEASLPKIAISCFIIQHIVTLPKYGHGEFNICRPHTTDILVCQGEKWQSAFKK